MSDALCQALRNSAAALSIVLMGVCGVRLLRRLTRVLRGEETASGRRMLCTQGRALWQEVCMAAVITLLSRLLLYALAYGMYRLSGAENSFSMTFERLWSHWDTRHYVGIAQDGYTAVGEERLRLVFFPLFPMMMRLFSPLTGGDTFLSGVLVSLLCAAGSGAMLFDLACMHMKKREAWLTLAYFLLSPMSLFLSCCYTEALFICTTLGAVCLLRRNHPYLAALCGAASAFTRMPGVIVAGLLIIRFLGGTAKKGLRLRDAAACAAQVLIVFSGFIAYLAINWVVTGDPFTYMVYQSENWHQEPGSFWGSVSTTVYYALTTVGDGDWLYTWGFQLAGMFIWFAMLAFFGGRLPFDLEAYSFVYTAVVLSPTWLLSGPRYMFALVPLHLLKAKLFRHRAAHGLALAASAVLLVIFVYGYTIAVEVL